MKRLLIVLALVVAVTSVAQAHPPLGWFHQSSATYGTVGTSFHTTKIWQYDGSDWGWSSSNVDINAQSLTLTHEHDYIPGGHWYCVDLNAYQRHGDFWFYDTAGSAVPDGYPAGEYGTIEGVRRAAWLIEKYHDDGLESSQHRAALQLAVWEAVYDNQATLDLNTGDFRAQTLSSTDWTNTVNIATEWYADSSGESGRGVYAIDGQNLLGRTEIPEPGTLILLGLGLTAAGVGVIRRRRKA